MSTKEIEALGQAHNMTEKAALAIAVGKNLEEFRTEVLDAITTSPINTPAIHNGETQAYSLGNAIRGQISGLENRSQFLARRAMLLLLSRLRVLLFRKDR